MGIETFNYIDSLNTANPTSTDNVSEGDDHLRGLKTTLKNTFPNVTGAINPTETELNYVDGVTSSIQTQLDAALPKAGGAMTGAITTNSTFDGRDVGTDGTKLDTIATSANNYSHPTGAGNKHIPSGGSTNQVLTYSSSGTATWEDAAGGGGGGDGNGTLNTQTFTSSGTWTKPADVTNIEVILVAGGGGGAATRNDVTRNVSGGGGGGDVVYGHYIVSGNVTVSIGAGGAGGTGSGSNGGTGGTSSLSGGLSLSVSGGGGGRMETAPSLEGIMGGVGMQLSSGDAYAGCGGGAGGHALTAWNPEISYSTYKFDTGTSTTLKSAGGLCVKGTYTSTGSRAYGGKGIRGYGGGGGGGVVSGYGGNTVGYGCDGGANGHYNATGRSAAANTGGGGGGTGTTGSTLYAGGDGGSGICIIKWWTA